MMRDHKKIFMHECMVLMTYLNLMKNAAHVQTKLSSPNMWPSFFIRLR